MKNNRKTKYSGFFLLLGMLVVGVGVYVAKNSIIAIILVLIISGVILLSWALAIQNNFAGLTDRTTASDIRYLFWLSVSLAAFITLFNSFTPIYGEEYERKEKFNTLLKEERQFQVSLMSKAQMKVEDMLKDPSSADFRNVFISNKSGMPFVCGEVNSKNSFGAYAGYQGYISDGYTTTIIETQDKNFRRNWALHCR